MHRTPVSAMGRALVRGAAFVIVVHAVSAFATSAPVLSAPLDGSTATGGAAVVGASAATPTLATTAAIAAGAVAKPAASKKSFPNVELHGYFRFRPDLIGNGHLGQAVASEKEQYPVLTTSSILPPLSQWPQNQPGANPFGNKVGSSRDETSAVGANMRLRLASIIHASDDIRVRLTVDALDNYVMGSQPDYAGPIKRPDVPLAAFAMTSKPGALRVTEAYGEWKTLFGVLRVGRQSSHWGLGILANGGMGTTWDGALTR